MSAVAFLRIGRLSGSVIITTAARHNKREILAEMGATGSINPTRSHLNYTLIGPAVAHDVAQLAKDLMTAAGVNKLRKDAVRGLEVIFSLPPGHAIVERDYFMACMKWAGVYFAGAQNILSADVHKDEAQDHCHILILPLVNGRMVGSDLAWWQEKTAGNAKGFYENVASKFGLSKAPARLIGTAKQAAAKAVLQNLRETGDTALQSAVWATIRVGIENDPAPYLLALGIELESVKKPGRTMAQIFTSKGKGRASEPSNPIGIALPANEPNPIRFAAVKNELTLCSVGFNSNSHVSAGSPRAALSEAASPQELKLPEPQIDEVEVETTRVRDGDLDPAQFDLDSGEYFKLPPPAVRQQRQSANEWVASALIQQTAKRVRVVGR